MDGKMIETLESVEVKYTAREIDKIARRESSCQTAVKPAGYIARIRVRAKLYDKDLWRVSSAEVRIDIISHLRKKKHISTTFSTFVRMIPLDSNTYPSNFKTENVCMVFSVFFLTTPTHGVIAISNVRTTNSVGSGMAGIQTDPLWYA